MRFVERSEEWGLEFRHHHGGSGRRYMVETVCGGVVVFDYDLDGDYDVLWIDGGELPGYEGEPARTVLHRNDGGVFVDVTERARIDVDGYGCGGAAGDVDRDGDVDLVVTQFPGTRLLINRGDGTFTDETERRGLSVDHWATSAAFADADLDGDLDLYVGGYVDFRLDNHKACGKPEEGIVGYCHPDAYEGVSDRFFRNRGDGVFEDATLEAGFESAREATLGVLFADVDDDLQPDVYLANDLDPNQLFRNLGDGTFEDLTLLSGAGYGLSGRPEGGMGIELADFDLDGRFDLFVTNFAMESNALYRNAGGGLFIDSRYPLRVADSSVRYLAFGVVAADLDHDGDEDLVIANGHTLDNAAELSAVKEYEQRNQVLENVGGSFTERMGTGLDRVLVSRGLAFGDLDDDGDPDLLVVNSNQESEVYENVGADGALSLQVALRSADFGWRGVGARVEVETGDSRQQRMVKTGGSYLSQSSLDVHFGTPGTVDALVIRWPVQGTPTLRIEAVPSGRRVVVVRPGG